MMPNLAPVDISIVVACRNEAAHIRGFLDSVLAQQMEGRSWEAIVADGMSGDGTAAVVEEYSARDPRIRLIANTGRIVSTGLNAAIGIARGRYILRMDAHTVYAADYSVRCVEALEESGADNAGGPARTRAEGLRARAVAAAYHSPFSTGGARFHDPDYKGWVDTVPYGCWRREVFDRIGLFDESLIRNQDDEFNLRLIRSGGRIWQDPRVRSWYSPRPAIGALFNQYFQYGFWKVVLIRKHRLPGSWRHLVPPLFVVSLALPPVAALIVALAGAGTAAAWIAAAWLLAAGGYVAANLAASLITARNGGWALFPYLPATFGAYHFSYGLGFLAAMVRYRTGASPPVSGNSVFARITR
jgi:succinoglycan biosynthesis protein ExoA